MPNRQPPVPFLAEFFESPDNVAHNAVPALGTETTVQKPARHKDRDAALDFDGQLWSALIL
jgi:hypothetical protein